MARTLNEMTRDIDALEESIHQSWRQINALPAGAPERAAFRSRVAQLHEQLGHLIGSMDTARYA